MITQEAVNIYLLSIDGILSPATVKWYRSHFRTFTIFFAEHTIEEITIDSLREWRKTLTDRTTRYTDDRYNHEQPGQLSPDTIGGSVRAIRRLFAWLVEEERLDRNPSLRLERPPKPKKVRKGIKPEAQAAILAQTANSDNPIRDKAIISLVSSSACRRSGIALLTIENINLAERSAVIREKGRGGNHKEREIYYSPATAEDLRAWLNIRPPTPRDSRLFQLTPSGIYQVFRRLAKHVNILTSYSPHQWRHATIRGWLNNGMPLTKASELAGHSSVQVTGDIYGTNNETELAKARDQYSD